MKSIELFNQLLIPVTDRKYTLTEDKTLENKFKMDLEIEISENTNIFRLVEFKEKKGKITEDENSKIKFLYTNKFPDGVFIQVISINEYKIFVFELKKNSTNYLDTIPIQLHSGILNAISLINLGEAIVAEDSQNIIQNSVRISYNLIVGTTVRDNIPVKTLKVIPGDSTEQNRRRKLYNEGLVYCNLKGTKYVKLPVEKVYFEELDTLEDYQLFKAHFCI